MKNVLYKGRPESCDGRLEKEIKCYDFLDSLGIEYERVDHDALMTMEDCAEVDKTVNATVCKNLLLRNSQKNKFYLLMIAPDKRFDTKKFSQSLEISRCSFAEAEFMEKFLDITPGSLSPLGLINDRDNSVRLIVDKALLSGEYIGVHPCINTSTLKIKTTDLLDAAIKQTGHDYTTIEI